MSDINIVLVDIDSNVDISIDPNILYVHSEWYFYFYWYFITWHFDHTDRELQMPYKKQEMDKHQNQHEFRLFSGDVNKDASLYYPSYKLLSCRWSPWW